ncbi:hypothetical protein M8J75_011104 [Diaphorina citri]|nr:hypothetical protein M8J75_011104 [Diaphorina citri]
MEAATQPSTLSTKDVTQSTAAPGGTTEDSKFAVDEISCIIKEAIEDCIGGNTYNSAKVSTFMCLRLWKLSSILGFPGYVSID